MVLQNLLYNYVSIFLLLIWWLTKSWLAFIAICFSHKPVSVFTALCSILFNKESQYWKQEVKLSYVSEWERDPQNNNNNNIDNMFWDKNQFFFLFPPFHIYTHSLYMLLLPAFLCLNVILDGIHRNFCCCCCDVHVDFVIVFIY